MHYEDFKRYIADNVKNYLLPEYTGCEISIMQQRKNNNVLSDTLSIKGKKNIMPVIYLEPYYHEYESGAKLDNILQDIAKVYMDATEQVGEFSPDGFCYEKVKDKIFVVAQNADMNRDLLESVPHEIRDDLVLFYRAGVELSDGERGSVLINHTHLDLWGIDEQTLKEVAWNNMHNHYEPVFLSMNEVLGEFGLAGVPEDADPLGMYVLSNKDKWYGAAYIFDKEVMNKIADCFGSDIIVLPSSIHETILLKMQDDMNIASLQRMVQEVNRTQLHPTEILSNEVYQYNRETQTLSRMTAVKQEELIMPDKVSMQEMHDYGYMWDGMLPISKAKALELMDTELEIYRLDSSGTESALNSREEVQKHDGLFGVEKDAWISHLNPQGPERISGMIQEM